jgi:multidrug efflux pump subunit AcrB
LVVSLTFTPIAILIAFASARLGHGDYFWATVVFPYTMLSTAAFREITAPFIVLAIVQYPVYGALLSWACRRQHFTAVSVSVIVLHAAALVLCLVFVDF